MRRSFGGGAQSSKYGIWLRNDQCMELGDLAWPSSMVKIYSAGIFISIAVVQTINTIGSDSSIQVKTRPGWVGQTKKCDIRIQLYFILAQSFASNLGTWLNHYIITVL